MNKIKKMRKIGLIAGISMVIGSVVGSGIFFKNENVFSTNDYSAIGTGIAWILSTIIALTGTLSFSEIGRTHIKTHETGISYWSNKYLPGFLGKFFNSFYTYIYYGIYTLVLGYLTSKFFVDGLSVYNIVDPDKINPSIHLAFGCLLTLSFIISHYLSLRSAGIVQSLTTGLKLVPLVVMIFMGIIFSTTHNFKPDAGANINVGENLFSLNKGPEFSSIIVSIPMILFAYDAFTSAPSITHKIKKGEKRMPYIMFFSMVFVAFLYLALTAVQLSRGTGSVLNTMLDTIPKTAVKPITLSLMVFISISAWGCLNGFVFIMKANIEEQIKDDKIWTFSKYKANPNYGSTMVTLYSLSFMVALSYLFGFIGGNDQGGMFILALSDVVPFWAFTGYALIIIFYTLNRRKHKHNKIHDGVFYGAAITFSVLCLLVMGYEFYALNIKIFIDGGYKEFYKELVAIAFWTSAIIPISLWYVNKLIFKK